MSTVPLSATIDVVVQLFILALLIASITLLKMKSNVKAHGILLAAATLINLGAIVVVMVPALLGDLQAPAMTSPLFFVVEMVHAGIGTIAEVLALYITYRWARNRFDPMRCLVKGFMGKGLMNLTFFAWIFALGLGLILYANDLLGG
jgi:uncharacterized membrane protein YozB (DUF420 family)